MSTQGIGNRVLTDDIIVKEALRRLKNNLVMAPLVYRDLEPRFAKKGDTISLKKPFKTKSASGRQLVKQPMIDQTIPFKISNQEHFGLEATSIDLTLSVEQFSERYLSSGIQQIANKIDRSISDALAKAYFSSGTPGTATTISDIHYGAAYMSNVGVPDDGMRRCVINMLDSAAMSSEVRGLYNENMVKTSLQKGYMGPIGNFEMYRTQNLPVHTVGDHAGTPLVNGAGQTGDELITDGWTASKGLNINDIFTINGVYEVNPVSRESTGRLQRFRVTETFAADSSGNAKIKISPSINDGSLTTTDAEGTVLSLAAYQNVSNAPAENAPITVIGTANTAYRRNFLFHKEAVALAMIDLKLPGSDTGVKGARARDPETGLSLTLVRDFDIYEQTEITRIDAVWGCDLIYPEMAHVMYSAANA